jgi:hypothetical protein
MDLGPYVENIQRQVVVAAEAGGDDARALAGRLLSPLDAAIRLTLQDALVAAVEEITCDLAPASVQVRLRGRDPEFIVSAPAAETPGADLSDSDDIRAPTTAPTAGAGDTDDGGMSRINLRMPDQLKGRVEQAAAGEGLSVNTWLVRAATAALQRPEPGPRRGTRTPRSGQRYTGWAR